METPRLVKTNGFGMNISGFSTSIQPSGLFSKESTATSPAANGEGTAVDISRYTADSVSLSPEAHAHSTVYGLPSGAVDTEADPSQSASAQNELTKEEQRKVQKLQQRDMEVKAHEAAHVAAAGQYAQGGASFDYTSGPDGKRYAVGGDVSISVSEEGTPEATISKMQAVRRAALAPASPSGQDRRVAAEAAQKETAAQKELSAQKMDIADNTESAPLIDDHGEIKASDITARSQSAIKAYSSPRKSNQSMDWAM